MNRYLLDNIHNPLIAVLTQHSQHRECKILPADNHHLVRMVAPHYLKGKELIEPLLSLCICSSLLSNSTIIVTTNHDCEKCLRERYG